MNVKDKIKWTKKKSRHMIWGVEGKTWQRRKSVHVSFLALGFIFLLFLCGYWFLFFIYIYYILFLLFHLLSKELLSICCYLFGCSFLLFSNINTILYTYLILCIIIYTYSFFLWINNQFACLPSSHILNTQ